ncbi:hypothetical protein BJG93_34745 (plasmid) [Paraburkholderia sprentiae WSM5005]|uniref:Uncharacterized protein n=1 Tax=Paraburkholderia sprentiae WSM5005 TaxID=754502 RepID=A0ACA8AX58_9BURK|nr:hypothetical protein [Paraburkholderia sprentiae]APA90273.1 hypothetical protein BJG93_34745 [Paraburkholderia sprentiae WSM5005]
MPNDWLISAIRDDFYYAEHQLPKPGFTEPKVKLDLSESQLDDAIRALFRRSRAKRRQCAVSTQTATVELSVITGAKLEVVWPAWTAIKDALARGQEAVPILVLFDDATADGAVSLLNVHLSYELKSAAGSGGFALFPSLSGRGGGEFAVGVNWHLWKAISSRSAETQENR